MKIYSSVLVLMLVAGIGCKKGTYESPPPDPFKEKKAIVTTIAGEGSLSFINGPALTATFHFPADVAVTPNGTIYITDLLNKCIRKLVGGQVSTFAGGGGFDIINGNGATAQFKNPYSITFDLDGNLYVTDENDPRIRKITPAADVTTYAGAAAEGFADGNADTARFYPGNTIVSDAQGNVYVADSRNNRIRKVSISGKVTTIAGNGTPGFTNGSRETAQFDYPAGITLDKQGNLYVIDRNNAHIRKITPEGNVSTVAAIATPFSTDTRDIAIDALGNLYVGNANVILKITPDHITSIIAGNTAGHRDGEGVEARFNFPSGMGIDAQGDLYIADLINSAIRKIHFE